MMIGRIPNYYSNGEDGYTLKLHSFDQWNIVSLSAVSF